MKKEILLSDFASPNISNRYSITLSKIRTIDYQAIKEKSSQLRCQSTGYQTLYIDRLDFCISHALIERLSRCFTISETLREVVHEKKDDWTLIHEALKNPNRSTSQRILEFSSKSKNHRLRFPIHFKEALQYVVSVFNSGVNSTYGGIPQAAAKRYTNHLSSLCNQSSPFEVYRLSEIYGEISSENNIKLWEFLALQFGFGDGDYVTSSISEFVARFQFFKTFIVHASNFGDNICKRIRHASLHQTVQVLEEEIKWALSKANEHWRCFRTEAHKITNQNSSKHTSSFKRILGEYIKYSESANEQSLRGMLPVLKSELSLPTVTGEFTYPKFSSLSNAIIHLYKHSEEISDYFNRDIEFPLNEPDIYAKATVTAYEKMINEVIYGATSFSWEPGQFGGLRVTFCKDSYRAIVSVLPECFSYLLTCF